MKNITRYVCSDKKEITLNEEDIEDLKEVLTDCIMDNLEQHGYKHIENSLKFEILEECKEVVIIGRAMYEGDKQL